MLVLLPPSEGKAAGGDGPPVDLATLSWPALTATRRRVGRTLASISRRSPRRARELLGLSLALDADRAANAALWESPTMPAGHRYAGVLYDALGYPSLPGPARRRADHHLVVLSGLWGATRPTDHLPAYRIGITTRLPGIGPLPTLWRQPLLEALDAAIAAAGALDLRSSGYSQMMRPSPSAAGALVTVRITGPDGTRSAPSYASKAAKGTLVREMLRRGTPGVSSLLRAAAALGFDATADDDHVTVRVPAGWPPTPILRL